MYSLSHAASEPGAQRMSEPETLGEAARQEPCHLAGSEAGGLGSLILARISSA